MQQYINLEEINVDEIYPFELEMILSTEKFVPMFEFSEVKMEAY
jgi:hypothetical protein